MIPRGALEHEDKQGRGVMHTRTEAFGLVRMEGGTVRGRAGHLIKTRALPLRRYGADPPTSQSQSQRQQQHLRPLAKLATSAVLGLSLVLSPPSPLCLAKQLSPAETIVQEVYEVVDQHFLDARDGGYSSERWQELRNDALRDLGKGKRGEEEDARRLAKRMLKRGIPSGDPYTRLLMPDEFERLSKYDVSGVGLNLGTREEYEQRVGSARDVIAGPTTTNNNAVAAGYDPFVVLGVVIHSPAEEAGIRQGDRILSIDGEAPAGLTPMQAAQRIKDARSAETRLRVMRASDGSVAEVAVPRGKDGEAAGGAAGAAGDLVRWAQGKGKSYPVDFKMRKGKDGAREGYVNLKEFTARAPAGVREALKQVSRVRAGRDGALDERAADTDLGTIAAALASSFPLLPSAAGRRGRGLLRAGPAGQPRWPGSRGR